MMHARTEVPPTSDARTSFEAVAEEVFRRHERTWKPGTVVANRSYLRNQIMPFFRRRPIADITRRDVQRWFATLHATPAAAGLPDVRLHDLRHSYASFALQRGESVPTIGRLLGHRDPTTTLRYTHFADALARDAVETVGAALASSGSATSMSFLRVRAAFTSRSAPARLPPRSQGAARCRRGVCIPGLAPKARGSRRG